MSRIRAVVNGEYVWLELGPSEPMSAQGWFHGSLVAGGTGKPPVSEERREQLAAARRRYRAKEKAA